MIAAAAFFNPDRADWRKISANPELYLTKNAKIEICPMNSSF